MMTEMLAREVAKATGAEVTIASSEVEAIEGVIPVEEAEALIGTMRGRTILSGPTVKTSILTAGVVHKTALRSIVVATS